MDLILILNIIIAIIIILILLILLILYIGLNINLNVQIKNYKLKYDLELKLLSFKVFEKHPPDDNEDEDSGEEEDDVVEKRKEDLKEKIDEIKEFLILIKDAFGSIEKFIYDVLKSIKINKLDFDLKLGLSDYPKTAEIVGIIWSIATIIELYTNKSNINAEAIFSEEVVDLEFESEFKVNLLSVFISAIKLGFKKPARNLIKAIIKKIRENK